MLRMDTCQIPHSDAFFPRKQQPSVYLGRAAGIVGWRPVGCDETDVLPVQRNESAFAQGFEHCRPRA